MIMERFLSPAQIADVLSISKRQAYNIIYQLPHIERPLRLSEKALREWVERSTVYPKIKRG